MSPADSPGPASSFWRCETCGTPNPWARYLTHCLGCGATRPARSAVAPTREEARAVAVPSQPPPSGARWLVPVSGAYAAAVLFVLLLIRWRGDWWWPATVLLFAPRWPYLLPVVALAALAGWANRRRLWLLHGAVALVVLGPLMGLSLPVGRLWSPSPRGLRLRVMTFNQGNRGYDAAKLIRLVEREKIQVICFQEGYTPQEGRPDPVLEEFLGRGWYRNRRRSIASRWPIVAELPSLEDDDSTEQGYWRARLDRVRLRTGAGTEFVVASVHMPSMSYALNDLLAGDITGLRRHIAWRAEKMGLVTAALAAAQGQPLLVGGDFNTPADSPLIDALRLANLRFGFAASGWGYGYTRPSAWPSIGIDHLLASPEWTFTHCWVGPDLGSDHLPLVAEVVLTRPGLPAPTTRPATPVPRSD